MVFKQSQRKTARMKKTVFLIIFILSFINATEGQGYYQDVVVKDMSGFTIAQLNSEMDRAMKLKSTGRTLTVVGTSGMSIGLMVLYYQMVWEEYSAAYDYVIAVLVFGGLILDLIGIPLWIIGHRTSKLSSVPNFDYLNMAYLNVSPKIGINQFNNSQYFGLSLSLNF